MSNGSETITLEHVAKDRNIFAKGCIKFINWIVSQKPGVYYKNDLVEPKIRTYSASGNIIMIVEHMDQSDWKEFVINQATKNTNLDGVIFVKRHISENTYAENSTSWTYYNRDGSEVPFCGNGVRCIGKYIKENYNEDKGKLISSVNQITNYSVDNEDIFFNSPDPYDIGNDSNIALTKSLISQFDFLSLVDIKFVNVGVPHLVMEVMFDIFEIDDCTFNCICSELYKSLNKGFNINMIKLDGTNKFSIRTFERGVDRETGSCGSGTLASYYYLCKDNKVDDFCLVKYKNGKTMKLHQKGDYYLKKYYLGGMVEML